MPPLSPAEGVPNLRRHPCGPERLRFDEDDLDLALQKPLFDQQRPFEFFAAAHFAQHHGEFAVPHAVAPDDERIADILSRHVVAVEPRHRRFVGLRNRRSVVPPERVAKRILPTFVALVQHIARPIDFQGKGAVRNLVDIVPDRDPDVVRHGGIERFAERTLPVGKFALDMENVMVVAADEQLFALRIDQHHAVIEVVGLGFTGAVSAQDHTDGFVGRILALEDILPHVGRHVEDVAHHRRIFRQRHERLRPRPYESLLGVIGRHGAERTGVADDEPGHVQTAVARGVVHRDQRMVADEFYPALRFQLLGDGARIVLGTGETGPIDHHARRAFERGHHLRLRLVVEIAFLKSQHVLVAQEMDQARILRHAGRERAFMQVVRCRRQRRLRRCDEKSVAVETEERHVLHARAVGIDRAGGDHGHRRNIGVETDFDAAVVRNLRAGQAVVRAGGACGQHERRHGRSVYDSFHHVS